MTGGESQDAIETLMKIYRASGDKKYLQPIPKALDYLKRSLLPEGRLARYYELETNKPLYMERRGDTYSLTHDDSRLPSHYGWKIDSRLDEIEEQYNRLARGAATAAASAVNEHDVRRVIDQLDEQGRWITRYSGERLVGQPKFRPGDQYISSAVFSENIELLSKYLQQTR